MPKFAANLSMMFQEIGFLDRFAAAALLDEIGYAGWIGCEYRPKVETLAGLGWAEKYGIG